MNREIKFRCWDKLQNKMINPIPFSEEIVIQLGGVIGIFNGKTYDTATDDFELMQFTGVTDNNGKEIYEGDILYNKSWAMKGFIFWDNDYFNGWAVRTGKDDIVSIQNMGEVNKSISPLVNKEQCTDECSIQDCEIIGNIYENENLLK